ncbi:MAG TPA: deoxyribose-phosphate aldolase [Coriobacteriia bacterium]
MDRQKLDGPALDGPTLAAMIDQTLLKPTAGYATAAAWIEKMRDAGFATLCVSPFLVPLVAQRLAGTCTSTCSVVGFPLGYSCTETKAEEARLLVRLGAREIDMVMNVAALLEGDDALVIDDITAVVSSVGHASDGGALVKVILETGHLTPQQIGHASQLAVQAGADYVKTSTGFGPRGASVEDVAIMRGAVGPDVGVKAAGGIRDLATALAMVEAGATRIGTSSGLEIVAALGGAGAGEAAGAGSSAAAAPR